MAVARLGRRAGDRAVACLTGRDLSLASRVARLLDPVPPGDVRRSIALSLAVVTVLVASGVVGASYGDDLLRALPFIGC